MSGCCGQFGSLCSSILVSCFLPSETVCILQEKPFTAVWMPVSASACGNPVFEGNLGLKDGHVPLWLLWLSSPFSASCCCDLCSASLCLFTANLSDDSKAIRRFWGKEKETVFQCFTPNRNYMVCVCARAHVCVCVRIHVYVLARINNEYTLMNLKKTTLTSAGLLTEL